VQLEATSLLCLHVSSASTVHRCTGYTSRGFLFLFFCYRDQSRMADPPFMCVCKCWYTYLPKSIFAIAVHLEGFFAGMIQTRVLVSLSS
jgi:hypothetical protein